MPHSQIQFYGKKRQQLGLFRFFASVVGTNLSNIILHNQHLKKKETQFQRIIIFDCKSSSACVISISFYFNNYNIVFSVFHRLNRLHFQPKNKLIYMIANNKEIKKIYDKNKICESNMFKKYDSHI